MICVFFTLIIYEILKIKSKIKVKFNIPVPTGFCIFAKKLTHENHKYSE